MVHRTTPLAERRERWGGERGGERERGEREGERERGEGEREGEGERGGGREGWGETKQRMGQKSSPG